MCNKEGGKLINTQHLCISNFAQSYSNKKWTAKTRGTQTQAKSSPAPDSKWWPSVWVEQTCRAQSRWSLMTSSQPVLAVLCQTAVHPTENHSTKVTCMDKCLTNTCLTNTCLTNTCLTNTWNCMSDCLFHPIPQTEIHSTEVTQTSAQPTLVTVCQTLFPHPSPLNWKPQHKGHIDKCPTNTCNCVSNVTSH